MKRFAVVGGIAAGKSTVCRMLETYGGVRLDADRLGHRVLRLKRVKERLLRAFGPDIVRADPSGDVDRGVLAARVFAAPDELAVLNAIVHPEIGRLLRNELAKLEKRGTPFVLIDAALFLDADLGIQVDAVIAVTAPRSLRRRRLRERDGFDPEEVESRLEAQGNIARWTRRADFRIDTQGSLDELEQKVARLWKSLRSVKASTNQREGPGDRSWKKRS